MTLQTTLSLQRIVGLLLYSSLAQLCFSHFSSSLELTCQTTTSNGNSLRQGVPGKRGPVGPAGPQGPLGTKGEKGEPGSDVNVQVNMQELRQKVEELEAKLGKHKSITCLFVVNYLKIMHHSYRPCLKFLEDLTTKLDRPAPKMFTGHTKLLLRLTEPPNRTFCEIFVAIILSPDDLQWF